MSALVDWLAERPALVLFLGLAVVMLAVSLVFTKVSEWAFREDTRTRTSSSITTMVGVVAGLYAVLVAFVIVNEWQAFSAAQTTTANESAALSAAFGSASALPDPGRTQIQTALLEYDRSVVCDELPYLRTHGGPNADTRAALEHLYQVVATNQPSGDSPFYTSLVNSLSDITSARRNRINSAVSPLPDLLLVVILATSFALIAAVSALDTQHRRWHVALTVGMSLLIALNLTLIIALDRPFAGAASVDDTPYREGVPPAALVCDA